jgi:hypothetical protein
VVTASNGVMPVSFYFGISVDICIFITSVQTGTNASLQTLAAMRQDHSKRMNTTKPDGDKIINTDVTGSGKKYVLFALLKFGQEQHLRDLLNRGVLYFSSKQTIRGSKKENSDDFRFDSLEGATVYESHGSGVHILMNSQTGEKIKVPALKVVFHGKPEIVYGNIISFYGITEKNFVDNKLIPVDNRMKSFGSHFLLIYDIPRFMKRLTTAMDKIRLNHSKGEVEYFDEDNHKGELHYYHKRSSLSYQNEYRIHLDRQSTSPYLLKVGNLREFAVICHSDTLEHLDIKLNSDNNSLDIRYLKPLLGRPHSS